MAAVIDAIGGAVDLLGHSHWAILALEAALRHTDRVRRLVLYEGGFPVPEGTEWYPPEALDRVRSRLEVGDKEGALTTFYRDIVMMTPEQIELLRSQPVWPSRMAMAPTIPHELQAEAGYVADFDPARLRGLGVPTLIMVGGDSPAGQKTAAEVLEAALPDGRVVVLPGQGHIAHRMAPELFAREVVRFLVHG